jgi:BirA family biotin operon repressor/biotin-[acetyl-CoA-carboxylase] ligase
MKENHITPEEIMRNLPTRFIGQKVIYYPRVDSTMEEARKEAQWGAPAGTVVICDEQTAGKGRLQRIWISPEGSLALSIILRPNLAYLPFMVMLASLSAVRSIELVTGIRPWIKWPNDILIKGKKICGILIQNEIHRSSLKFTIIGIGININMHMQSFPEIEPTATSLLDELGKPVSRVELARQLLIEMENLYHVLSQGELIFEQWKDRLITLGQYVRVTQEDKVFCGYAESVVRDGSLMLRQADGQLTRILTGDVSLRPINPGSLAE